jgi:hypothetical protein
MISVAEDSNKFPKNQNFGKKNQLRMYVATLGANGTSHTSNNNNNNNNKIV